MAGRSLNGARVLITGASSGIGRELALALAREKAQLLLLARRAELLDELCRACRDAGASAHTIAGDVTDANVRAAAVEAAGRSLGGLDVLVNNAGVSAHGFFVDSEESVMRKIMEVNFFAAVELTRHALPLLLAGDREGISNSGPPRAIVNIGSILGHRGAPWNNEYCASKFALRGWTESIRAELAGQGIDVILASPGSTDTEFFDHLVAKTGEAPWGGAKGVSPATVAARILEAVRRGRPEAFPDWRGRLMVMANRLVPGLVERRLRAYCRPNANRKRERGRESQARK